MVPRLSGWSSIDEEGGLSRKSADGAPFLCNVYATILELQKLCGFIVKNPEKASFKSFKELLRNSKDPSRIFRKSKRTKVIFKNLKKLQKVSTSIFGIFNNFTNFVVILLILAMKH